MNKPPTLTLFCRYRIDGETGLLHPGEEVPESLRRGPVSGGRMPCVFIHAFPLDSRAWESAVDCAASEGHPAFALDLPGFGRSSLPAGSAQVLPIGAAADRVVECLDVLGVHRAVLIGCSMGGYVIFSVLRARPDVAAGLLLADTRATADTEAARAGRFQAVETIRSGARHTFLEAMKERLLAPGRAASDEALSAEVEAIMQDQSDEALIGALRGLAERDDFSDLLPSIAVPVTVVVGERDAIVSVSEAETLAGAIPGATLEVVPGCGHLPNLEAPERFNSVLRALLERVRRETPPG